MRQTTLCVPLQVKPESCSRLCALIDALCEREDKGEFGFPQNFARVKRDIPSLHFMSMSVFTAARYDPTFILEANLDGPPSVFWGQLEAAFGPDLREMLRCCKQPLDRDGPLYGAVTAPDSRAPMAPYLEARSVKPSVFHHGNRGLTRDRILREAVLFGAVQDELDRPDLTGPNPYRGLPAAELHQKLRARLRPAHPWLDDPPPARITKAERLADLFRLVSFAVLVLLFLSLPGLALSPFLERPTYAALMFGLALLIGVIVYRKRRPLPGTGIETRFNLLTFLAGQWLLLVPLVLAYVVVATLLLVPGVTAVTWLLELLGTGRMVGLGEAFWPVARTVLWGLLSLIVTLPLLVLWLRFLERRDSSQDAPPVDERLLREMVRREDWVAQNHMGSIVLIRPGVLRTAVIRAGHLGLGLLLRVKATTGYLGSMRTVHFAHWAFLDNGSRLLFFSNFDHSWDSYLDDFIEKAHVGLTLAWGCGVGFPPTRFLIFDGASHGRQFKNWALASRAVSRFWYSAYPDLTVDQIERNVAIADGLRKPAMTEEEARTWAWNL